MASSFLDSRRTIIFLLYLTAGHYLQQSLALKLYLLIGDHKVNPALPVIWSFRDFFLPLPPHFSPKTFDGKDIA